MILVFFLLDPVSLILAVFGAALTRRIWHLCVIALVVAVAVESIVAAFGYGSSWGQLFVPRLIAASVHTAIGYGIFRAVRRRRIRKLSEKYRAK